MYGIVVGHHGFIDVESVLGSGSTFNVFLPLAEDAVAAALPPPSLEFPGGTETLLIVDDEEPLRDLLSRALSRKGYQVVTASNGPGAIDLISDTTRAFDAVLLDLNMPGANGIQVLKVIRLCRPRPRSWW